MADRYVPAPRHDRLTAFYDPIVRFTTRDRCFKLALIDQSRLEPDLRVLDRSPGSGTPAFSTMHGTLALYRAAKRSASRPVT